MTLELLAPHFKLCGPYTEGLQAAKDSPCLHLLVVVQSQSSTHSYTLVSPGDSWLRAGEQVLAGHPSGITGKAAKPLEEKQLYTKSHFIIVIEK